MTTRQIYEQHHQPIEDFTLPHRFLVIPPGIHVDWWSPPSVAMGLAGVFAISVNKICKIMEIFE